MNHDTKQSALPALTADFLRSSGCLVDNLFAYLWKEVGYPLSAEADVELTPQVAPLILMNK